LKNGGVQANENAQMLTCMPPFFVEEKHQGVNFGYIWRNECHFLVQVFASVGRAFSQSASWQARVFGQPDPS
jgi:hypothetical protein